MYLKKKMVQVLNEILFMNIDDGVKFEVVDITDIRADDEYGGNKYHIVGKLENLKVALEIDISTGDEITPKELNYEYILQHVFTLEEERGKGYAANLIHDLTQRLLADGLKTLLYTDYSYQASNREYINAGYEDNGILIDFSCSREKKKSEKETGESYDNR